MSFPCSEIADVLLAVQGPNLVKYECVWRALWCVQRCPDLFTLRLMTVASVEARYLYSVTVSKIHFQHPYDEWQCAVRGGPPRLAPV